MFLIFSYIRVYKVATFPREVDKPLICLFNDEFATTKLLIVTNSTLFKHNRGFISTNKMRNVDAKSSLQISI
jgi:hypothetical protein